MNKICICRDIYRALSELELELEAHFHVSTNEAMLLCCLSQGTLSASQLAERCSMGCSHTSKIIRQVESKGLIYRELGDSDKRQMYFSLTEEGQGLLAQIERQPIQIPELLQPVFERDTI